MAAARRAPWSLNELCFTITFSRGRSPGEVLGLYGADPAQARTLTWQEACDEQMFVADERLFLRSGKLGHWAFGYEALSLEGLRPPVLQALSEGTDTLVLFWAEGKMRFGHWRDGVEHESFEPGLSYSRPRSQPRPFWDRIHHRYQNGSSGYLAAIEVIDEHIRTSVTHEALSAPALTLELTTPAPDHLTRPRPPASRKGLGKSLGALRLDPPPPSHTVVGIPAPGPETGTGPSTSSP
ncbi:DUF6461 domain-containing protein [Kineosporia succinea]|uniref:Uncharacterized protein n=1 Tax=Kineosporia succinea TaxID=84632 RepID=A0ABT9NYM5_9ACTN|nr:DUF6461 domain-containing protein [Kineosporia succinea]MDP9824945.1 hypothetical protein [Kineosporia succinea]